MEAQHGGHGHAIGVSDRGDPLAERYRPRILIAEDDEDVLRVVTLYLGADGYSITAVKTADDLLADLDSACQGAELPAVVISDERLPGMEGLRALQQVREWGWTLPLVLLTSSADDALARKAKEIGVTVLRTPVDTDEFRALISVLAPRRLDDDPSSSTCAACGSQDPRTPWDDSHEGYLCQEYRPLTGDTDTE